MEWKPYVRNLRIVVLSWSVGKNRLGKLTRGKHSSSLLRKFVNYGQKSFKTLGPCLRLIEFHLLNKHIEQKIELKTWLNLGNSSIHISINYSVLNEMKWYL